MLRRLGDAPPSYVLGVQSNLACTYDQLGRLDESLSMRQDVYSGYCRLMGEENRFTISAASNYAWSLIEAERFKEAKSIAVKLLPVAQKVLGKSHDLTFRTQWIYAAADYRNDGATADEHLAALKMLEETARTARHALGAAHPTVRLIEQTLMESRFRSLLSGALFFAFAVVIVAWLWQSVIKK